MSQKTCINWKKLRDHEHTIQMLINDKNNPYSNCWVNNILKKRYNVKLVVRNFINGVAQLDVQQVSPSELPKIDIKKEPEYQKYFVSEGSGRIPYHTLMNHFNQTGSIKYSTSQPRIAKYNQLGRMTETGFEKANKKQKRSGNGFNVTSRTKNYKKYDKDKVLKEVERYKRMYNK